MSKIPPTASRIFTVVREVINHGGYEIPEQFNGTGAPGEYLEFLLNLKRNNDDIPDLGGWEIKFHGGNALLTLFHNDPLPRGIINQMVNTFGWENERGQISFRHTISGQSNLGFNVTNRDDRIYISHNHEDIEPYWENNTILNAIAAKLRRLILVHGRRNDRTVVYNSAIAYWDLGMNQICNAIETGIILIDFDARTKGGRGTSLRNHGTKFRIRINDIGSIYQNHCSIL